MPEATGSLQRILQEYLGMIRAMLRKAGFRAWQG